MGIEIERKFLVKDDSWQRDAVGTAYRQGYLCSGPERTVRVRVAGDRGYLTIKGRSEGLVRSEFEYAIPVAEAEELLDSLCPPPLIEKIRYRISAAGHLWEVDVFSGANEGLVLAEVELAATDEDLVLPSWVGEEVSADPRYYNANLARHPFITWQD